VNIRLSLVVAASLSLSAACAPAPVAPAPVAPPPPTAAPPVAALDDAAPTLRLPTDAKPSHEAIELHIDPKGDRFSGAVDIDVTLSQPRAVLWLHGEGLHVTRASATPEGGAEIQGTWAEQAKTGIASVRFAQPLPAGNARVHIDYDGAFGTKLVGLYKQTQGSTSYAFTQFESTSARKAFPCFDEPSFKIPYDVTLVVPADAQAIANTPEVGRTPEAPSSVRVRYAPTQPLPSYLLAFAVGPLDVVSAPDVPPNAVRPRPLPLRAITTKGRGKDVAYALAHTGDFVTLLELYLGVAYPYEKLDILAVGDKGGAMENAGAITFADSLLLFDEKTAPLEQKRGYADVMAHELAHQWTGDLVTMAWWDDTWLNEAFASWIAAKIADQWNPAMQARQALLESTQRAIGNDGLVSARATRQPIVTADDIENAFDGQTYWKGGAVLAMFERWVGADVFQRGLHDYLQAHRFGNATADDFLAAESAAAGKDVKTPFHTFLDQPGVPLIETEVKCDGSPRLHLKQSRYLPLGSTGDTAKTWQIPVCARFGVGKDTKEACTLLANTEADLPLGETCPAWVLPNADFSGYYRFALAPADLKNLHAKGYASLNPREREAYANGLRAAFNRHVLPFADVLTASEALVSDPHADIADEPLAYIYLAKDWFADDKPINAAIERYTGKLFRPAYKKVGWSAAKGEDPDATRLRGRMIYIQATVARDPAARAEAKKRGLAFLGYGKDGALHPEAVDPNLLDVSLITVGEDADRALWDSVKAQLAKSQDQEVRGRLLEVLATPRSPDLVSRVRDLTFDPVLRTTEVTGPLWNLVSRPETRDATWKWIKDNYDKIVAVLPDRLGLSQVISMANGFCDETHAKDIESFFTAERLAKIDGGPRVLASTLEDVRLCAAKRKLQEADARAFFAKKR
jgi:alanyl aminopeptidase